MFLFLKKVSEVQNGLSVSAFARELGMKQKTVDLYMKGERKPSVDFVWNICSKFGVSADWLLGLPSRGGNATASAPHAIAATGNARVTTGNVATGPLRPVDCSKCKLMQAHIKEITGR